MGTFGDRQWGDSEIGGKIEPDAPGVPNWPAATESVADGLGPAGVPRDTPVGDDGNATLFVDRHGEVIRYVIDAKRWYRWDGARWIPNADTQVLDLARETVRSLGELAGAVASDHAREKALKHAARSLHVGPIEAISRLAKSDPRVASRSSDFDINPLLLNTATGTFDFTTGQLREHDRSDFLSCMTAVPYLPAAQAAYWRWWVLWAMGGREDLAEFLQRCVGYAITGETSEQVFFLLYGMGANGKTTFLNVIETVLGDYAWHADPELLSPKDGAHPTGVADLHKRRFVVASETREGRRLDERTVKQLTGQDTITARRMYQDFFTFRPTHKIFFAVNHRPVIQDDSTGMWRRVLLIPWGQQVSPDQQVRDLANRIVAAEGAGVLQWMIEGALKWLASGLCVPDDVKVQTSNYRANEDSLGTFIDDCLELQDETYTTTSDLWSAYELWCSREGVTGRDKLGRTTLLNRLENRKGIIRVRPTIEGRKVHAFKGIRLRTQ